jgi:hypothetical protein
MEFNKQIDHKSILNNHFPNVIVDMILLYIGKFNLRFVESSDEITYAFIKGVQLISDQFPKISNYINCWDIIDDTIILLKDFGPLLDGSRVPASLARGHYKIFNIKTSQIVKEFYHRTDGETHYCSSDGKYIIFLDSRGGKLSIFDIDEKKIISNVYPCCMVTMESMIINDIIYTTSAYERLILKYTIFGIFIGIISFEDICEHITWSSAHIRITNNEIIIIIRQKVLFYDLEGIKLGESTINQYTRTRPKITSSHVYVMYKDRHHKYERIT